MRKKNAISGMSLIEAIMAIGVFVIGIEGVALLFLTSWRMNKFVLETGNASFIASRGVNAMVSDIRKTRQADNGDYPVEFGDDFDLKIYLDIDKDGQTERVHYYLSGTTVYRGITNPVPGMPISYPATDDFVETIATSVVNTTANPMFYYYNGNYPTDTVNNPLATPIGISDVRMIRIHLMVNIDPLNAPDNISIESLAELRNLSN